MKRVELLTKIEESGVIAVVRGASKEQGKRSCEGFCCKVLNLLSNKVE